MFHHKIHWESLEDKQLEENVLSKRRLKAYAKDISFRRKQVTDRAIATADMDEGAVVKALISSGSLSAKLLNRGSGP